MLCHYIGLLGGVLLLLLILLLLLLGDTIDFSIVRLCGLGAPQLLNGFGSDCIQHIV